MNTLSYKTLSAKKENVDRKWWVVDAEGQVLGRLASKVAKILQGKHKPCYTPHVDCGDYVIIVNADKIKLTGKKWEQKEYKWHTGYPGGLRSMTARELWEKDPARLVEKAVKGMLPKSRLGRQMYRKLHVYAGPEHKHQAQQPEQLDINTFK
ncbi:MAG: 50S ribosomal protein L13 [Chlorobi bacterium]|nr:50S ribosomal protein L13 [Chlorobiota bacterium]